MFYLLVLDRLTVIQNFYSAQQEREIQRHLSNDVKIAEVFVVCQFNIVTEEQCLHPGHVGTIELTL